jgi:uncharacterized protein (TIGR02453 family)
LTSTFAGFPPETQRFLAGLTRTNTRAWFEGHRAEYERFAKAPMLAFVQALDGVLARVAPAWVTEPKKALFRLNRDTRFSADKSPYKTSLGARFGKAGGPGAESAGFYVSVGVAGVEVGAGCHVADTPQLQRLRARIAREPEALRKLVEAPATVRAFGALQGERLVRVPKPYATASGEAEHPAADLLRLKQAYFLVRLPAELATSATLVDEVGERLRLGAPLVAWLADAVG